MQPEVVYREYNRGAGVSFPGRTGGVVAAVWGAGALVMGLVALPTQAMAIPSPELVVGALSGLSQLGALVAALLGGGAAAAWKRGGRGAADHSVLRRQRRLAVGLGLAAVVLAGLNVWQWSAREADRRARLEATLVRPSRLPGQPVRDPTLKELSFAQQSRHRLGISTAEAQEQIERARETGLVILDIREPSEVEMGTFKDAVPIRFPDLAAGALDLDKRKVLLICHNGNRSSETCQRLAARGIDCRFLVGGLEKWIVEGRRSGGFYRASLRDVRALPDYPNAKRLLDTAEVIAAVRDEGAIFVDMRYPGEFDAGHLPGAVNIPMRRMTSPDVAAAISGLPRRPVIVPCYDRRSCFFGEVMGLALTRAGHTFLGRYTVPWDYAVPRSPPPHVAQAMAAMQVGWWSRAADALADGVTWLAGLWGLPLVVAGLALLSRLIVLPLSLKAERDQMVAARIDGQMQALKVRYGDDPARRARAIQALYRRHGLTPLRNQLALLLLPVLALGVEAVGRAAEKVPASLAWMGNLAQPDPWLALPIIFGAAIALYIHWTLAGSRRAVLATWLLAAPGLAGLVVALPAASALYLVTSAGLLLVQRGLVTGLPGRVRRAVWRGVRRLWRRRERLPGLEEAGAMPGVGNKAQRLGLLAAAGVPVPAGIVLTGAMLARWPQHDARQRRRLARSIAARVGGGRFAVRSSGAAEDGAADSFAGVFESLLDVTTADLPAAIDRVLASFHSVRAASYGAGGGANILVQRMVDASYAGVLFTRAPDAAGQVLIEMVAGTGDSLVSGLATPDAYRFGRHSGQLIGTQGAPLDLAPLIALGRRAESLFGRPQDIEWTWTRGRFALVQSRDITRPAGGGSTALEQHWDAVLGVLAADGDAAARLVRDGLCELLPRPTRMSQSLLEAVYAEGGSVDRACRALGLGYRIEVDGPPMLVAVMGRLHVNEGEARRRAPRLSKLDERRLRRRQAGIEAHFRNEVAAQLARDVEVLAVAEPARLETGALLRLARSLVQRFVEESHVEAEIVNILAEHAMSDARRALVAAGEEPARWLTGAGETMVQRAIREAILMPERLRADHLRRQLGHRAPLDYELAQPRFAEDPAGLQQFVAALSVTGAMPPRLPARGGDRRLDGALAARVATARRLQTLKEDAKHVVLRQLAEVRRVLLAIDARYALGGRIFDLTLEEMLWLDEADPGEIIGIADARRALAAEVAGAPLLAAAVTLVDLETASGQGAGVSAAGGGALAGTRVAGRGIAEGRALVVPAAVAESGSAPPGFRDGDILVTPMVHPAWLPYVLRAGGVVSQTGGWLSHMAIVARERDIAMVVGATGLEQIADGARLRLHADGRIEVVDGAVPAMAAE